MESVENVDNVKFNNDVAPNFSKQEGEVNDNYLDCPGKALINFQVIFLNCKTYKKLYSFIHFLPFSTIFS